MHHGPTHLKSLDDREQAVYFHSRERRRSLGGIVELYRKQQIFNETRTLTVTGATNATPIVITTSVAHRLLTGMTVTVSGVSGNTAANTTTTVTVLTTTTFEMDGTVGNGVTEGGGTVAVLADMPVQIDIDQFPDQDVPITFQTAIRITDAAPAGLIFEIGNATTAVAAWIDGSELIFRAGDTGDDRALASFENTIDLPDGLEVDLVFSVRPGDGRIRIWANGNEIARDTAVNGQLPNGWAAASDGAFATAANGTLPADVTETGTPTNFEVIEPLSVYVGQVPRHFI